MFYLHKYSYDFSNFNDIVIQFFRKTSVMTVATLHICTDMNYPRRHMGPWVYHDQCTMELLTFCVIHKTETLPFTNRMWKLGFRPLNIGAKFAVRKHKQTRFWGLCVAHCLLSLPPLRLASVKPITGWCRPRRRVIGTTTSTLSAASVNYFLDRSLSSICYRHLPLCLASVKPITGWCRPRRRVIGITTPTLSG